MDVNDFLTPEKMVQQNLFRQRAQEMIEGGSYLNETN